jgi:hypothetical protein
MSTTPLTLLVCNLRQAVDARRLEVFSDAELLDRYRSQRDPAAFEAIIRRHGERVFAACYKVRSLRRARVEAGVHQAREETPDLSWRETCAILHEELDRLPERFRLPLILCYLEGKSRDEAAQELGWSEGVLRGRLERGRDRLRHRLMRRGITLSAGLLAEVASPATAGGPPSQLLQATLQAAATGRFAARIGILVRGVSSPLVSKLKLLAATVLAAGLLSGVGLGLFAATQRSGGQPQQPLLAAAELAQEAAPPQEEKAAMDISGQVVGPDGKLIPAARLFVIRLKKPEPRSDEDVGAAQAGTTAADGTFRLGLPLVRGRGFLIAHAEGFGVDFLEVRDGKIPTDPVTLKLVKDQPITGRVLNTEGKPLPGITVRVAAITFPDNGKLDDYLAGWKRNWQDTQAAPPQAPVLPPPR